MDKRIATINTLCGDALDLFKDIKDSSVDLIVADPPYNLGKDYGNNVDAKEKQAYLKFTRDWLRESRRVLKPTGSVYIFMGVRFVSYLYMILEEDLEMNFNSWIVWHYTQGIGKKKGLSPRHDDILFFTKTTKFTFNIDEIKIPQKYYRAANNMRGANPGNVWKFSHVHYSNPNRQSHPTQKPEGLIERIVLASSNRGDTVLDPFSGSGTTQRVCQQLERNCIGFEKNPEYVQMTNARLAMPFNGFDSSDDRNFRIPNDLRDPKHRLEYLVDHAAWFLRHHESDREIFYSAVEKKYGFETMNELKATLEGKPRKVQHVAVPLSDPVVLALNPLQS